MNNPPISFFIKLKPCYASVVLEEDGSTRCPGKAASAWQCGTELSPCRGLERLQRARAPERIPCGNSNTAVPPQNTNPTLS